MVSNSMNQRRASSASSLHFVFAPPGYGKTTGLMRIFQESGVSLVFLSPLRAIAEEVRVRAEKAGHYTQWGARRLPPSEVQQAFICSTFENFCPEVFNENEYLFVIDEFHLLFYWEGFRPLLLEGLYDLACMKAKVLALSATMKDELFCRVREEVCLGFDHFYLHDLGGGSLLYGPKQSFAFHFQNPFEQLITSALYLKLTGKRAIFFVSKRHHVSLVVGFLKKMRIRALGCVGGEAADFQLEWYRENYQVVVATTVLSHGVNLGEIRLANFLYEVSCEDFYLQMLARAGRDGRGFIVMHRQGRLSIKNLWEIAWLIPLKLMSMLFIILFGRVTLGGCKQRSRASSSAKH